MGARTDWLRCALTPALPVPGTFDILARQIQLCVVPPGTKLALKPHFIEDWDSLSVDEKRLFARQIEVFAGFGEYTDHEIGRLMQALANMGQLDNTLIYSTSSATRPPRRRDWIVQRVVRFQRGSRAVGDPASTHR